MGNSKSKCATACLCLAFQPDHPHFSRIMDHCFELHDKKSDGHSDRLDSQSLPSQKVVESRPSKSLFFPRWVEKPEVPDSNQVEVNPTDNIADSGGNSVQRLNLEYGSDNDSDAAASDSCPECDSNSFILENLNPEIALYFFPGLKP